MAKVTQRLHVGRSPREEDPDQHTERGRTPTPAYDDAPAGLLEPLPERARRDILAGMPDKVLYTAEATSTGDGRNGHVASSDSKIDLDLAFPPEMGGSGAGSNPEQLFAAGYAACFHSALRLVASREHVSLGDSTVTAQVGIGPDGDAFEIGRAHV